MEPLLTMSTWAIPKDPTSIINDYETSFSILLQGNIYQVGFGEE